MIVIPMGGLSARFFRAGFTIPKYQLLLQGESVFAHAVRSFDHYFDHEHFVFVIRTDYGTEAFVRSELARLGVRWCSIVPLAAPTRGQAETVEIGVRAVGEPSDTLTIFNIDTFRPGFHHPPFAPACDGYLEVFHGEGEHWSFVDPLPDNRVRRTTEKERISSLCSDGLYYFRSASLFSETYDEAIAKNLLVNGEIYVAPMYNLLIERGMDIRYMIVEPADIRFCGTPDEYAALLGTTPA